MSKPPRTHGGLLMRDGRCHSLSIEQALARYDHMLRHQSAITSDQREIRYELDGDAMVIPHTSELFEHLQRQLSYGLVHAWYQRNPGKSLVAAMDTAGDQLIEEYGISVFQVARSNAVEHDEQHLAYLASLPTALPPNPPRLKLVK